MKKVCTAQQMRLIDMNAWQKAGIPSVVLMENAAISCVEEILKTKEIKKAGIFCGKGNNAGDGFAIARHLFNKGINVSVFLVCGNEFSGDALTNFEIISNMGIPVTEIYDAKLIEREIESFDIVIDAIFGTGIKGEIAGISKDVIEKINENSKYTFSVDIPSGVMADTGKISSVSVKADKTVTFAAYKRGQLLFPGADFCGDLKVCDISIPKYIIDDEKININVIDREHIEKILPKRKKNTHKGDYPKVLIIGGAKGMSGAVCMAAKACMRSGAGLVTVCTADCLYEIVSVKLSEQTCMFLKSENGHLSYEAANDIISVINDYDVCLFGPGIGRSEDIQIILKKLLKASNIPLVIDADGLFALSKIEDAFLDCSCDIILTPHEMEMARLLDCEVGEVSENRLCVSMEYAKLHGVTLILKGAHTIVTSPSGEQYININGNCGMATGGSGDVLAGICAAFSTRCQNLTDAAMLSVYIHASSGDIAKEKYGYEALIAGDIIDNISNALKLPVE